ncbi:MAG: PAS domain S-box protein [Nitrospinae bacterium]|nr:PAS domain S-box protein [Nitrospinota bacterium]
MKDDSPHKDSGSVLAKDSQSLKKTPGKNLNKKPNPDAVAVQEEPADPLRKQAEATLRSKKPHYAESWLPPQARELLNELRVYQIELEMQNKELLETQERLETAKAKYFDFYNLAPVGYFTLSGQGVILEANSMSHYLCGVARDLPLNTPFTRFIFREDQDIYYLFHKKLLETGMPQTCELRMARQDGGLFWAGIEATVATDAEIRDQEIHIVIIDITERKLLEDVTRRSEERFHALFDNTTNAIILFDAETLRFEEANPAALKLYGYTKEEFLTMTPQDTSAEKEKTDAAVASFATGQPWHVPLRYHRKKDGTVFPVMIHTGGYEYEGRKKIIGAITDLTAQKKAEESLRRSEEQLRAIFEQAGVGVAIVESATGRFLRVNRKYADIVGLSAEELLISSFDKITHPDDVQIDWADMEKLKNGLISEYTMDKRYIHKNGSIVWVSLAVSPLWHEGRELKQHIAIVRDITERKQAETSIIEKQNQLSATLNAIPDLMFEVGIDGRFYDYRSASDERLAAPPEAFLGKLLSEILPPPAVDTIMSALREARDKGRSTGKQLELELPQGRFWYELSVAQKTVASGQEPRFIVLSRDVTERKLAEEELKQRTVELDERIKELNCLYGISKIIAQCGKPIYEIFEEVVRLIPRGWIYPEITCARIIFDGQEFKTENFRQTQWRLSSDISVSGKVVGKVEVCYLEEKPTLDEGPFLKEERALIDQLSRKFGIMLERKQVEEELIHTRNNLEQAQRIAHLGNWEVTFPEDKVTWSDEAFRIYGMEPGSIVPDLEKIMSLVYPEDRERVRSGINEALQGQDGYSDEFRIVRANGDIRIIRSRAEIERGADGALARMLGTVRDVTERRREEQALRESEARYRKLFDNANDYIFTLDIQGRFISLNQACTDLTGYTAEEIVGAPISKIVAPEYLGVAQENLLKKMKGEATKSRYELDIIAKDGRRIQMELSTSAIYAKGAPAGVLGIARNVTERNQAQEALRLAKEKAEAATKLKDQFVSLVAHDLRSPFAAMMGLLKIYAERQSPVNGEEDKKILDRVFNSGDRMIHMIEQLLKISRLQSGKITPQPRFFKGYMSAAVTIGSLVHNATQKGIVIVNELPVNMRLYADPSLFDEVLMNLLSNAIKFCSRGDTITIFAPPKLPSAIAVRDTGKGIDGNKISNLFRHDVATSTPGTAGELGTGLGLPFSHDIMKAHGGELTVESEHGKGSVFCAKLPYVKPIALVVDDEPMSQTLARILLEKIDIAVVEALSGEEALSAIRERRPHIIITDIMMPGMDGFELLNSLKHDVSNRDIPVIVVTAVDIETRERALRNGADDFVRKPIEEEDFIPRVRRFVG